MYLTYEPMSLSLKDTIDRANKDGVKYLLTISTENKSFAKIIKIITDFNCVYGTYEYILMKQPQVIKSEEILSKTKQNKKIIGIGETG